MCANGIYIPKSCNLQHMDSLSLLFSVKHARMKLLINGLYFAIIGLHKVEQNNTVQPYGLV